MEEACTTNVLKEKQKEGTRGVGRPCLCVQAHTCKKMMCGWVCASVVAQCASLRASLHLPVLLLPVVSSFSIISHLLTRIRSSEHLHPSSTVFLQLRVAVGNLALPVFFFWSPLALLVVILSLFSV